MKLDGYELKMTFIQSKKVDRNDWNICKNASYTFFVIFQRDIHKNRVKMDAKNHVIWKRITNIQQKIDRCRFTPEKSCEYEQSNKKLHMKTN